MKDAALWLIVSMLLSIVVQLIFVNWNMAQIVRNMAPIEARP